MTTGTITLNTNVSIQGLSEEFNEKPGFSAETDSPSWSTFVVGEDSLAAGVSAAMPVVYYDEVSLEKNYDDFYLNPDLESLLNSRGFSTQRAEILGMFNFEEPLEKEEGTDLYLITPYGEIFDYQCQLKQLRYSDALGFFTKMIGFSLSDASSGHVLSVGEDTSFATTSDQSSYLSNYTTQMELAKDALDYMTLIYNAISEFIDAQMIKDKSFQIFDVATESQTDIFEDVIAVLPGLDEDYSWSSMDSATSAAFPNNSVVLSDYMSAISGYSTWLTRSSNTTMVLQLFRFIAAGLLNPSYYSLCIYGAGDEGDDAGRTVPINGLIGLENLGTASGLSSNISLMLKTNELIVDLDSSEPIRISSGDSDEVFLKSHIRDFMNYNSGLMDTSHSSPGVPETLYRVGIDIIQGMVIGKSIIDGTTIGPLDTSSISSSTQGKTSSILLKGISDNIYENKQSIVDSVSDNDDSLERKILARNNDTSRFDSRSIIETFTSTNYDLADGVSSSRSGRSYYCDEIPTLEFDESKERLQSLIENLSDAGSYLTAFSKLFGKVQAFNGSTYKISQPGYKTRADSLNEPLCPSTLYNIVVARTRDAIEEMYEADPNEGWFEGPDGDESTLGDASSSLFQLVVIAGLLDDDELLSLYIGWLMAMDSLLWPDQSSVVNSTRMDRVNKISTKLETMTLYKSWSKYFGATDRDFGFSSFGNTVMSDAKVDEDDNTPLNYLRGIQYDYELNSGWAVAPEGYGAHVDWVTWSDDDGTYTSTWRMGHLMMDPLYKTWNGVISNSPESLSLMLSPITALNDFLAICRDVSGLDSEYIPGEDNTKAGKIWSSQGYTRRGILLAIVKTMLPMWSKSVRAGIYFNKKVTSASVSVESGRGKTKLNVPSTGFTSSQLTTLIMYDLRSLRNFIDGAAMFTGVDSGNDIDYGDIFDVVGQSASDDDFILLRDEYDYGDDVVYSWNTHYGNRMIIYDIYLLIKSQYAQMIGVEKTFIGSVRLTAQCLGSLKDAANNLFSVIDTNEFAASRYDEALASIKSDPSFQKAALLSITRDQITLNRALYDSFSIPNREYPYLPATKAMMTNQSKNLGGFIKNDSLVDDGTNRPRKFIMPVGITAGLLEALRNRMMDETGNVWEWRYSTIVEISIWKRDLLNESKIYYPKKYVFDTSRFIISGRPEGTDIETTAIDGDMTAPDPQDFDEIVNSIVVRQYTPDGNTGTWQGKISDMRFKSMEYAGTSAQDVDSDQIFFNHVMDYELNTFMRLTTGFDVGEDVFPFLEGNVFFEGPDRDKVEIFETLATQAKEMFVDRDIEAALNYDRLIGEISRSIVLSPEKYRNRIVYPKIFERVFCILVDPDSFEEVAEEDSSWIDELVGDIVDSTTRGIKGEYCQYYATIGIKPYEDSSSYIRQAEVGDLSGGEESNIFDKVIGDVQGYLEQSFQINHAVDILDI